MMPMLIFSFLAYTLPVVQRKAVAEVLKKETFWRGCVWKITDGRANPVMVRKVVGVVCLEWLQWLQ